MLFILTFKIIFIYLLRNPLNISIFGQQKIFDCFSIAFSHVTFSTFSRREYWNANYITKVKTEMSKE